MCIFLICVFSGLCPSLHAKWDTASRRIMIPFSKGTAYQGWIPGISGIDSKALPYNEKGVSVKKYCVVLLMKLLLQTEAAIR